MSDFITLQSRRVFNDYALMNKHNGDMQFYSKLNRPVKLSSVNGLYEKVDSQLCILFKHNQELYLKIDTKEFHITDKIVSTFRKKEQHHIFELKRDNESLIEIVYLAPILEIPLEIDPTPFIEYEDFDFLFFVNNVLNENGRRNRVFSN